MWVLRGHLFNVKGKGDTLFGRNRILARTEEAGFAKAKSTDEGQDHNCERTEVFRGGAMLGECGEAFQGKPSAGFGGDEAETDGGDGESPLGGRNGPR